jgi:hypothetical protein
MGRMKKKEKKKSEEGGRRGYLYPGGQERVWRGSGEGLEGQEVPLYLGCPPGDPPFFNFSSSTICPVSSAHFSWILRQ